VCSSLYRRWLVGSRGIFPGSTTTPSSPHNCTTATAERAQLAEMGAWARLGWLNCPPRAGGLLSGPGCVLQGGLAWLCFAGLGFFLFCFGPRFVLSFHVLFLFSWPICSMFPYITYKTRYSTKTMEFVSLKALSLFVLVNFSRMLAV